MALGDLLLGRPLKSSDEQHQKIGFGTGLPLMGIDALSSSAYGTEAALFVLIPVGLAGLGAITPITAAIIILMIIILISYCQTIRAYPHGGGSYAVASENLGRTPGLVAASALLLDYILVVAIGASAGVAAIVSAYPPAQPYIVPLSLMLIAIVTIINLRGVKESGAAFAGPVWIYILLLLGILGYGCVQAFMNGGTLKAIIEPAHIDASKHAETITWFLIIKSFSNGCAALTGIEAVANGVQFFKEPAWKNAQRVLIAVVLILAATYGMMAYLSTVFDIRAMSAHEVGYRSVLSQIVEAIIGRNWLYWIFITALLILMALSANTAFAGFPAMTRILARDDFMPHAFGARGRRLVFHTGIWTLTICASILIIALGGLLERLIPLYAVGVFVAFTLSQWGMVIHWNRTKEKNYKVYRVINGTGAIVCGFATIMILYSKFFEGAWIALILVPGFWFLFMGIKRHYIEVYRASASRHPIDVTKVGPLKVVVPVQRWSSISERGITFAMNLSPDVTAIHIETGTDAKGLEILKRDWNLFVEEPLRTAERAVPELKVIHSPYRRIITPILEYVRELRSEHPNQQIVVVIPELVEARWYQYFLHNQRAQSLKAALLIQGEDDIVVMNVPWYLHQHRTKPTQSGTGKG